MRALPCVVAAILTAAIAAQSDGSNTGPANAPMHHTVTLPPAFAPTQPWPLLVLVGDAPAETAATIARAGWVVVAAEAGEPDELGELLATLRQRFRVDQVGMHVGGGEAALRLALDAGTELQTVTLWGAMPEGDALPLLRLRGRRVRLLVDASHLLEPLRRAHVEAAVVAAAPAADALAAHFAALHAERALPGAAGEVASTLDAFHDAAAKGDEGTYFAILPDDAVFLGTDASERWTGAQFRAFAMPYFQRGPAWTYVPLRRAVTVAAGGALAWFDEDLDNAAYGACRGTGVLEQRDGRWVVRQYHLTIPVPNELAREFVARIRAAADGR